MEAATNNTEKRGRGRPPAFSPAYISIWTEGHGRRGAINNAYMSQGLGYMQEMIGSAETLTVFKTETNGIKYQGPLEQLGRIIESGLFMPEEIEEAAALLLQEIEKGTKSKDIEAGLRNIRKTYKEARSNS